MIMPRIFAEGILERCVFHTNGKVRKHCYVTYNSAIARLRHMSHIQILFDVFGGLAAAYGSGIGVGLVLTKPCQKLQTGRTMVAQKPQTIDGGLHQFIRFGH